MSNLAIYSEKKSTFNFFSWAGSSALYIFKLCVLDVVNNSLGENLFLVNEIHMEGEGGENIFRGLRLNLLKPLNTPKKKFTLPYETFSIMKTS